MHILQAQKANGTCTKVRCDLFSTIESSVMAIVIVLYGFGISQSIV